MKKIKYLIMGLVTVFGAASCADFLEVEPKDRVTGNALLSSDGGINAYMAGHYYNLPIEELMAVMDNAVKKGYTFAWGSDVSEQGFSRDGIAVMPDAAKESELSGSDMARWTGLTAADKRRELFTKPFPEKDITQEMRQVAFDNWETTDDHGMVIYGIAKDQNGKEYFMVKNSWGKSGKYDGIWYASKAFVAYKTMNILVHKDALPKEIAKKLGIK